MSQFECKGKKRRKKIKKPESYFKQKEYSFIQRRISDFVLFRVSTDRMRPTHITEGNLFTLLISSLNTLIETPRRFGQIYEHSMASQVDT